MWARSPKKVVLEQAEFAENRLVESNSYSNSARRVFGQPVDFPVADRSS
jgi:hypothetical protein